jgi:hypothetical protein
MLESTIMSFRHFDSVEEAFRREALRLVEESGALWTSFAATRRLRMVRGARGLPAFEGNIENTNVSITAVGSVEEGFRTRAVADAKIAMPGWVVVAPPGEWDELVGQLFERHSFADPELDRLLVVKTSSKGLAHVVLDARVLQTVRALAPGRLVLDYRDGAISLMWAGIERSFAILDDVLEVLAYLAVQGGELSPYR